MNIPLQRVRSAPAPGFWPTVFGIFAGGLALVLAAFWVYMRFFFTFDRPARVQEIALGDLNGDGYLDAYLAAAPDGEPYIHPDYLLFNDGQGHFTDSGQDFGEASSFSVKKGDVNGDGLLDIVVGWHGVKVYRNYGRGTFKGSYSVGSAEQGVYRFHLALADLNQDGYLDIIGAGCCGAGIPDNQGGMSQVFLPTSQVWLGNSDGNFSSTGQTLGQAGSHASALADLNGDGTLDVFFANGRTIDAPPHSQVGAPNTVWFNDGQGHFTDSGQQLGNAESYIVALGDVNGDGFNDAVVGNYGPDEIWINDGKGNFSVSGQALSNERTYHLFLVDLDSDGDLDLVSGGETRGQVWLNDGTGQFQKGQPLAHQKYEALAVGDVTGDGLVDVFVAGVEAYSVWRGDGDGSFTANPRTIFATPSP